jgi:hypothetical protein
LRDPATYAVDTWTRWGREPDAATARYSEVAPTTFARKPSSIGESNETVAAQW